MPVLDWKISEEEAFVERAKIVEEWSTRRVPVMTPENAKTFGKFKITKQVPATSICLAVYGVGGSGKTTLCAEIVNAGADGSPALHVDIDRSSDSVTHLQDAGLDILKISSWQEALDIRDMFKKGGTGYKAISIDNVSELLSLCVKHYAPRGMPTGTDALKTWGLINADMMEFVRDLRTYCTRDGVHMFLVLWEETEKDPATDAWRIKFLLSPKFGAALPGMTTLVGRLTVPGTEKTDYVRLLDFSPDERYDKKWRTVPTGEAAKIPMKLYLKQGSNFVVDYLHTVKHGKPFPAEKYEKPKAGG